jgi:hypothetical protein
MPLDVSKIDERIKKLQELRRMALDPEMTTLLSEFLVAGDTIGHGISAGSKSSSAAESPLPEPNSDEVSEIVKGVLDGTDSARLGGHMPGRPLKKV